MKKLILIVWMILAISFLAMNVAGQESYNEGFPNLSQVLQETATLNVSATVGGGTARRPTHFTLFIVLNSSDPIPTIQDVIDWSWDGNGITIIPEGMYGEIGLSSSNSVFSYDVTGLSAGTDYVVYIVTIDEDETVVIETDSPTARPFTTPVAQAPLTASLNPLDNSIDVPIDQIFEISFSEAIQYNPSGTFYIELYEVGNAFSISNRRVINGVGESGLQINGNKLSIDFPVDMDYSTEHYITIQPSAIQSISFENFVGISGYEWSFTTEAEPIPVDPPVIIENGYFPAPGEEEVPLNSIFTLTFNEDITFGEENSLFLIHRDGSVRPLLYNSEEVSISTDNRQLIIDLTNTPLTKYGTDYYILIEPDFIKSIASDVGFEGITNPSQWTFTTESAPPEWVATFPFISDQNQSSFTINAWADMIGTYYGVVTTNPVPPTIDNIKSGSNARISFNEVVNSIATASSKVVDFNLLTPTGYDYFLHVVYANVEGNKNSEVRTLSIDRKAPDILITNPIEGRITFPVDSVLTISFDEPAFAVDGTNLTAAHFSLVKNGTPNESISFDIYVTTESEMTSVILDPVVDLLENTSYTLIINSVYDLSGNVSVVEIVNFETDGVSTWTGDNSTDWTAPGNWLGGSYVPFKSVVIPSSSTLYPEITTGIVDVHNLIIESGAALTQSGGILNVTGEFHLLSSSDVNASYLTKGGSLTMGNNANVFVHQSIPVPNDGWIFLMGSPTLGANAVNSGSGFHMRQYDNSTDTWSSIGLNNMIPGIGYSVYSNNDLILRGEINRMAISANLIRTNGMGFGWNVLGNPFTSSLIWGDIVNHPDNSGILNIIENNYWVWNPSQNIYNAFNQEAGVGIGLDGTIPSNHGFLVKVAIGQTGGDLVLVPEAQVANTNNYLKSASSIPEFVKLRADGGDFHDKLAIAFIDEATEGLDKYDTEKRFGSGVNPFEIFSVSGATNLTINSSPYYSNKEISLGFNARKVGTYSFGIDDSNIEGVDILLLDKVTGEVTNLQNSEYYSFEVNATGRNTSRFLLRFVGAIATKEALPVFESRITSSLVVFVNENNIFVEVSENLVGSTFQFHDLSGRLLHSDIFINSGTQKMGQFSKGIYLLSVETKGEAPLTQKIVVY